VVTCQLGSLAALRARQLWRAPQLCQILDAEGSGGDVLVICLVTGLMVDVAC